MWKFKTLWLKVKMVKIIYKFLLFEKIYIKNIIVLIFHNVSIDCLWVIGLIVFSCFPSLYFLNFLQWNTLLLEDVTFKH